MGRILSEKADPKVRRKKNKSNEDKCKEKLARHKESILIGTVLCIDPSCGSESSMPGWALFKQGVLISAGTIELPHRKDLKVRLRMLFEELQGFYVLKPTVILLEEVPVKALVIRGIKMKDKSHNSLMQSIGVVKASFPAELPVIDFPASLWSRISRTNGWAASPSQHAKSDALDAIRIGKAALHILGANPDLVAEEVKE
jgi:hypothetical protein